MSDAHMDRTQRIFVEQRNLQSFQADFGTLQLEQELLVEEGRTGAFERFSLHAKLLFGCVRSQLNAAVRIQLAAFHVCVDGCEKWLHVAGAQHVKS